MLKMLGYLKKYKWMIVLVFGLIFIQAMAQLYLPTLMANIIDDGVVPGNIPYIWRVGGVMLVIAAVGAVAAVIASLYASKAAMGAGRDIRRHVFHHVEQFTMQEIDEVGTASLITRTTNDITQVQRVIMMVLRIVLMAPIMFVGGVIMALSKDVKLSLVILVTMPFLVGSILFIFKKGMPLFREVQKRLDRLNLVLRENLTGVRVIRAFNREKPEQKRLKKANTELTDVSVRVYRIMSFMMPVMMLVMNMTIVCVIWFGGIRIDHGGIQIGDLMAFIQYVMQIMFALIMASMMFVMIPRAAVSAARINDVLEMEPSFQHTGDKKADKDHGALSFDHVTFYYPGAQEPALTDIHFTARPGEVTAIIGGTGSGKSTLINLIPNLYEISSGSIRVNGVDLNEASIQDVRSKIGLVPQTATLFTGTIADNIRFGKKDATYGEMEHAASIAQADEFIQNMHDKYDAKIVQNGSNLSGGQQQRLSIARALVRQPDIYLFDDSFSALDYKTDAKLRHALQEEARDATMLIVAQRVTTVMNADQIIVMDNGKIAGIGTHEELMKTNAVYKEIADSQLGEEESA